MAKVKPFSLFTDFDIDLFRAGIHYKLYEKLGSHITVLDGQIGVYFAVWAPTAKKVSVIGDFNFWTDGEHELSVRWDSSGIWEGFIPGLDKGTSYKYKIHSGLNDQILDKADPFAKHCETPPYTASKVWDTDYTWYDGQWMDYRKDKNGLDKPFSVYEVHLESWMWNTEEKRPLSYVELAVILTDYVKNMGFTHVEFMPIMEYPYSPSWGYQITGFFAPTSRFGTPGDFKWLVDRLHQNDIGVILDWVPSHFPDDAHGLGNFDGSHLYEHPDPKRGYHPDWKSLIFNYGRNEIRSFLISNALYWLDQFHIDGLRVDAVASMIYLDYSRNAGEWEPNKYGGNENLEAIEFMKEFNMTVYKYFPDTITIAEESTAYSGVTRPVYLGGLGFGMKWMMGWMHDTLSYFKKEPIHRKFHHDEITFSLMYTFSENFMLPLSHDEVVYGKKSLLDRMPGDDWQRFANLRLMLAYMYSHPGNKLIFMGAEFGQSAEWKYNGSLDWHLTEYDSHRGVQKMVRDLNHLYKKEPALYEKAFGPDGFEWVEMHNAEDSILIYRRKGHDHFNDLIIASNFTPVARRDYKIAVDSKIHFVEIFNSDHIEYWGSGVENTGEIIPLKESHHGRSHQIRIHIPPLGVIMLKKVEK